MGNYSNIVDSARLILHGGVLALSLYVFGYLALAWLDMAGAFYHPEVSIGYLFRFIAWLFGPHPLTFWNGFADTIALVSHMIVEPLRVCLIASTVAYCLEQVQETRNYNSNRTVIRPSNWTTSIAVGTASCGSKNVN